MPQAQTPALFHHRLMFRIAFAAGNIFAWMIVFRVLYSSRDLESALAGTAILFALSQFITFFLTPLSGMALRNGVRRALVIGTLMCSLSFACIAALFGDPYLSGEQAFWLIAGFVIVQGMYRALYWIPYTTEAAATASPGILMREVIVALMPALGGVLIEQVHRGASILFFLVTFAILFSALFLTRMREKYEPFEWTYLETLQELTHRSSSRAVGLFILDGIQGATLLLIWPLAVFILLDESFQALGAIMTATLLIAYFSRTLVKHIFRALNIHQSPVVLSVIAFSSWFVRLAAGTPVQVLIVDVYYNTGFAPRRFSIDSHAHEQPADGGHYVDEYTAIKEMGLAIGRIAASVLFAVLALTTVESLAFAAAIILAAASAAWSVFIAHRLEKEAY